MSIDHILDYIKNTIRELEVLHVEASERMQQMSIELTDGAASLALGLARFRAGLAKEVANTVKTREAERNIEDLYREALEDMFQGEEYRELAEGRVHGNRGRRGDDRTAGVKGNHRLEPGQSEDSRDRRKRRGRARDDQHDAR